MKLLNKFKKAFKRKNGLNEEMPVVSMQGCFNTILANKRYADAYLWLIYHIITNGLANVRYGVSDINLWKREADELKPIFEYVQKNLFGILYGVWNNGYIAFRKDKNGELEMVPYNEIVTDITTGDVIGYDIVYYSDEYRANRSTMFGILYENINQIDSLGNADNYLTSTLGALGILSSAAMPLTESDQEDLLEGFKRNIGITSDKFQFIVTQSQVDFHQIDFKIKELQLPEKIEKQMLLIAGNFGIPVDLLPFAKPSTFDNQKQAYVRFYRNCITPCAKIGLSIIQQYIKASPIYLPADKLKMDIVDVPELEKDIFKEADYAQKLITMAEGMQRLGWDTTNIQKIVENYGKDS